MKKVMMIVGTGIAILLLYSCIPRIVKRKFIEVQKESQNSQQKEINKK